MDLHLRALGFDLTADMQARVERRVRFALARFGHSIERVACAVSDLDGPRGDKHVRLKVKPRAGRSVVVEEVGASVERALDAALDSIARGVARELQGARERSASRVERRRNA